MSSWKLLGSSLVPGHENRSWFCSKQGESSILVSQVSSAIRFSLQAVGVIRGQSFWHGIGGLGIKGRVSVVEVLDVVVRVNVVEVVTEVSVCVAVVVVLVTEVVVAVLVLVNEVVVLVVVVEFVVVIVRLVVVRVDVKLRVVVIVSV